MDIACCLRQPNVNVIGGGAEGTSYRILERLNKRAQFSCKVLGRSRLFLEDRPRKKLKFGYCSKDHSSPKCLGLGFRYCLEISRRGDQLWRCQGNDSVAFIHDNGRMESTENSDQESTKYNSDGTLEGNSAVQEEEALDVLSLEDLQELLQKACTELEVARVNSTVFEEKAHRISETAISLKDEAENARNDVNSRLRILKEIENEGSTAKQTVHEAMTALSLADARLQFASDLLEIAKQRSDSVEFESNSLIKEEEAISAALTDIKACEATLLDCEAELKQVQIKKDKLQKELDRLKWVAEKAESDALKAEEDVANIMLLAEQAVALEVEATQRVNDAEIALQRAEKMSPALLSDYADNIPQSRLLSQEQDLSEEVFNEEKADYEHLVDNIVVKSKDVKLETTSLISDVLSESPFDIGIQNFKDSSDQESGSASTTTLPKETEIEAEKSKNTVQKQKAETQKDLAKDSSPLSAPKALLKKSSRFFSASFF